MWSLIISLDASVQWSEYARLMPSLIRPLCRPRKLAASVTTVLFLNCILSLVACSVANRAASIDGNYRVVERVIDGDTLLLDNGERVRLIGVDTPETKHPNKPVEHFGKEAAAFTQRMVEGKRVRLEFDPANASRAHKDSTQQRRTLAYVFLEDGTLLMRRLSSRAMGSPIPAFRLHLWKNLGDLSMRRWSNGAGYGHLNNLLSTAKQSIAIL